MEPVNALGAVLECLGEILRNVGASAEAAASAAEAGKPALAIEINGEIEPMLDAWRQPRSCIPDVSSAPLAVGENKD